MPMLYTAKINRKNRGLFEFLLDPSGSMARPFGCVGSNMMRKADGVADVVNRFMQNLTLKCATSDGVLDRFDLGVIHYSQPGETRIESAFIGPLAGQMLMSISQIAEQPARLETRTRKVPDGAGGLVEESYKFPIWIDPRADGGTPMCQGLQYTYQLVKEWVANHPQSFPPIVIHITDGEATDGYPEPHAEAIKSLATQDGNVLLFNCHLSSTQAHPIIFPYKEEGLPDQFARILFRMSSIVPETIRQEAQQLGFTLAEQARGFSFNADLVELINFLAIGGTVVDLKQGGATWGTTREEALQHIHEVVQMVVQSLMEHGEPIPDGPPEDVQVSPEAKVAVTV